VSDPDAAETFLRLVATDPSRVPHPAPADADWDDARKRMLTGSRVCVRCGAPARWCAVIGIQVGTRWLDLCWACAAWMSESLTARLHRQADEVADQAWLMAGIAGSILAAQNRPERGRDGMPTVTETACFRPDGVQGHAIFSSDHRYRYSLARLWGSGPVLTFVLLNPSTADAHNDDPTIRRCMGFARREGYLGVIIANLFALRSTDPKALTVAADPVGPDNRTTLLGLCCHRPVVAAWGANAEHHALAPQAGWARIMLADADTRCFGTTSHGSPRHPLYLPADARLESFR
jgi:hypothetical protein